MGLYHQLVFRDGTYTWMERYYNNSTDTVNSPGANAASADLADKRSGLLGIGPWIQVVRQSTPGQSRKTWPVYKGESNDPGEVWSNSFFSVGTNKDSSPVLAAVARYDTQNSFAMHSHSGWPAVLFTAPRTVSTSTAFGSSPHCSISSEWAKWKTLMTNGQWGIRAKARLDPAVAKQITALSFVAGSNFIQVTPSVPIGGVNVGSYVQLSGITGTFHWSDINGIFKVTAFQGGVYTLRPARRAPAGWSWTPSGLIYSVDRSFEAWQTVQLQFSGPKERGARGFQVPSTK